MKYFHGFFLFIRFLFVNLRNRCLTNKGKKMKNTIKEIKGIYRLITKYFPNKKYEFAKNEFISCLYHLYADYSDYKLLGVTDISVDFSKKTDKFIFKIKLKRPGILVGKGGENLDKLKDLLQDSLCTSIEIIIIEEKLY